MSLIPDVIPHLRKYPSNTCSVFLRRFAQCSSMGTLTQMMVKTSRNDGYLKPRDIITRRLSTTHKNSSGNH